MANVTGAVDVVARGKSYCLWLSFSGLAELQAKHGNGFIAKLDKPEDAPEDWLPDFAVLADMIWESLQRFHSVEADRWLVDDIWKAEPEIATRLFAASFPDQVQGEKSGNGKRAKRRTS